MGAPVIPARIIQTARSRDLSLKQRALTTSMRLLNPEFEWVFFDDDDVTRFVDREFPQHRNVFDRFPYAIQRFDFFRYLAVYRLGGFYFDMDVVLAKALEPLRRYGCVFPFEGLTLSTLLRSAGMDWQIGNYGFGATAGHAFLGKVVENCVRGQIEPTWVEPMMQGVPWLSRPDFRVLNTTGPGLLSRTLAENPGLTQDMMVLFPDDVCDVRTWNTFGDFGIHLMDGTWRGPVGFVRRRLTQRWEVRQMRRLIEKNRANGSRRAFPATQSSGSCHTP